MLFIIYTVMIVPQRVYSVKYKDTFLGFHERVKFPNALVFTFFEKKLAQRVHKHIKDIGYVPKISQDHTDKFTIFKQPTSDKMELVSSDLVVVEHETEPLILQFGLNMIDMCVVHKIGKSHGNTLFESYSVIGLTKANNDFVIQNLNHMYDNELPPPNFSS